ncbi:MAG: DUF5668 domain-containing protein [bacterium]|nr:DUF5668 domain-containing protein [bacterium]
MNETTGQGGQGSQMVCGNCGRGCGCMHHKIVPLLVVVFGLVFLLGALDMMSMATVGMIWPVLVILGGLTKLSEGMCKCCK